MSHFLTSLFEQIVNFSTAPRSQKILILAVLASLFNFVSVLSAESVPTYLYATEASSINDVFSGPVTLQKNRSVVDKALSGQMEKKLGMKWRLQTAEWTSIMRGATRLGYAIVIEEIGKHEPITFCVVLNPQKQVLLVNLLIYRESIGSDIRKKRFMKQFISKNSTELTALSQTVPVTGSTLSSWATVSAVKKALIIGEYVIP